MFTVSFGLIPRRLGFPLGGVVVEFGRSVRSISFYCVAQRIVLTDERLWRFRGVLWQRYVCPALFDGDGRKLATSALGHGAYAATCRDRGFTLISAEKRLGRLRLEELIKF